MADDLEELESAVAVLERFSERFEPAVYDFTGNKRVVDLTARGGRFLASIQGRSARWMEQAVCWKTSEHRSAAHLLSSATGVTVGAAARTLETARRLEELPETSDAFRAGELSEAQAAEIAAAATLDPSAEHLLLETVRGSKSFESVRDACREVSMRAEDDRAKARWLHEQRSANWWTDSNGHFRLDAKLSPDDAAWVQSALVLRTEEIFRAARASGQVEPHAAYRADALVASLTGEAPRKPLDARLHADQAALDRGYAEPGEQCELEGIGPIPVTMARSMLDDARVTRVGHDDTGDITHISSMSRTIPARLRRAVEEAYPCCDRGPTEQANLWRLCRHHHKLKTFYNWNVIGEPGHWQLVPPDTPDPPGDPPRSTALRNAIVRAELAVSGG